MNETIKSFSTERTRRYRSKRLSVNDERTISRVEKFGCEVVQVTGTETSQGWSYTVGIYDTCGQPEVIAVGLPEKTALFLLNEAARRLRQGIALTDGRHREMVGEVECEFRPVDPKWVKHLMLGASWYYEGGNFPVLQAVYPDTANRFPEDPGFDTYFQQPLMQPEAPLTVIENDFWASANPDSRLFNWKFPDPPRSGVFVSAAVNSGTEPVTYVSHDLEDGAWQFLGDSMSGGQGPVLLCLHHVIDNDPTLVELADLPQGWWAERAKPGEPWMKQRRDPDEAATDD
jgi:Domain of unknown function (DUF4262)